MTAVVHAVKQWHRGLIRGFEVIGEFVGELLAAAAPFVLAAFFACLVGAALFGAAYLIHAGQFSLRLSTRPHDDPIEGVKGAETVIWTSAWTASTGGELLVSPRGERTPEEMAALVAYLLPRRS